jgi:2-polyprenyl-3-methyl-5-hydroxy-6-metoxy-1,4-benzoquinol methylase
MNIAIIYPLVLTIIFSQNIAAKNTLTNSRLNKLSGAKGEFFDTKSKWDQRYNRRSYVYGKMPAKFLAENFSYFKPESTVLDMGMGEGQNAVFLAQKGHIVTGIDISSVAIKKSKKLAKELNVKISTIVGTLTKYPIKKNSYDVVICFYYVSRELNKKMISWLKPGGLLVYEANTIREYEKKSNKKLENKSHYLKEQELLSMFSGMRVLKYEEPLHEKEYRASIILQKKGE